MNRIQLPRRHPFPKRRSFLLGAIVAQCFLMAWGTGTAGADALLGLYADPDAQGSVVANPYLDDGRFDVYAILFTEDVVNAVAYDLDLPGLNEDYFLIGSWFGPESSGINVVTPGGNNVGLGSCEVGFGGRGILVARYQFVFPGIGFTDRVLRVTPNPDADPLTPIYSDCQGTLHPIELRTDFYIMFVPNESKSWGAVKSLYGR